MWLIDRYSQPCQLKMLKAVPNMAELIICNKKSTKMLDLKKLNTETKNFEIFLAKQTVTEL